MRPVTPWDGEAEKLYKSLLLSSTPRRDRAILQLFLHFGCSARDIANLELSDLDLRQGRLRWNRPEGTVVAPLPADVVYDLRQYVERERRGRSSRLFLTPLGHPVTVRHVLGILRRLQRDTGVQLSPSITRSRHRQAFTAAVTPPQLLLLRRRWPYLPLPALVARDKEDGRRGGA
ncbi:MAG: site-specific integrase [Clostridia bacterium]|nr:site-specific integrase [Clostridia bacterium]